MNLKRLKSNAGFGMLEGIAAIGLTFISTYLIVSAITGVNKNMQKTMTSRQGTQLKTRLQELTTEAFRCSSLFKGSDALAIRTALTKLYRSTSDVETVVVSENFSQKAGIKTELIKIKSVKFERQIVLTSSQAQDTGIDSGEQMNIIIQTTFEIVRRIQGTEQPGLNGPVYQEVTETLSMPIHFNLYASGDAMLNLRSCNNIETIYDEQAAQLCNSYDGIFSNGTCRFARFARDFNNKDEFRDLSADAESESLSFEDTLCYLDNLTIRALSDSEQKVYSNDRKTIFCRFPSGVKKDESPNEIPKRYISAFVQKYFPEAAVALPIGSVEGFAPKEVISDTYKQ
jgi:hypothetical protein